LYLNGTKEEQKGYVFTHAGEGPDEDADMVQILNNKVQDLQKQLGTKSYIQ
jgi:hypothetical protein